MTDSVNTRELILDMLVDIMEKGMYSHIVLRQTLKKYQYLEKNERSFITRITEGTVENIIYIDYVIDSISNTPVKKMKPLIRNLLRMSVYQMKFMDAVPDSAICNEAVKLSIKRGFGTLKGFVNGVLRNVARRIDTIELPNASEELIKYLSIFYSMPEWIVEKYIYDFGAEETVRILKAYQEHDKKLCVRCNTNELSVDEIISLLEEDGVTVSKSKLYENALYIENYDYLEKLNAFINGYIQVQDFSSMLVTCVANPKPKSLCMDLCAAPGGKTTHLAEALKGSGRIIARDISEKKLDMIRENVERAGYSNVEIECFDATLPDSRYFNKADVVIADVPCSGLGVIGKKQDIKYKVTQDSINEIIVLQRKILINAARYLKKGGELIFSTCTINPKENIGNLNWLVDNCGLEASDISDLLPKELNTASLKKGYIQIIPGRSGNDGFFISKLIKK